MIWRKKSKVWLKESESLKPVNIFGGLLDGPSLMMRRSYSKIVEHLQRTEQNLFLFFQPITLNNFLVNK